MSAWHLVPQCERAPDCGHPNDQGRQHPRSNAQKARDPWIQTSASITGWRNAFRTICFASPFDHADTDTNRRFRFAIDAPSRKSKHCAAADEWRSDTAGRSSAENETCKWALRLFQCRHNSTILGRSPTISYVRGVHCQTARMKSKTSPTLSVFNRLKQVQWLVQADIHAAGAPIGYD